MQQPKDYIKNIDNAERRFYGTPAEIRTQKNGKGDLIEGYAALFNSATTIGTYFREEILEGAFDEVLKDDVRALFNHNPNYVLARSNKGKGTLTLTVDDKGLRYSYKTPDTTYAKDLTENIRLENISQSSFAFSIEAQEWVEREGELPLRRIKKFSRLIDVSPVTYPAYADTTVAKRSLDAFRTDNAQEIEVRTETESRNEQKRLTSQNAQCLIYKAKYNEKK